MNLDNYNSLSDILSEFQQDRYDVDYKIQYNLRCIKEAEAYSKMLIASEPDDVKVFSPRNMEALHKQEIEKIQKQKSHLEEENKNLYDKRYILSSRIDRIEKILKSENNDLTALDMQEQDRQRIARDLHDTSLQNLAHLIHQIELSGLYIDQDPVRARIELTLVKKKIKEIIDDIRNTIFDLRPMTFDDLGLKTVLERLIDSINIDKKYEVELELEEVSCETNLILVTIYRLVQECLNNIVKHADATKIFLSCKCRDEKCYIVVRDNGKGFIDIGDDGKKHFGIFCMKERVKLLGGNIQFDTTPDEGTIISIEIPLGSYEN